ncbi:alpha/beta hydrolase family protein [Hymenobacter sp. PAMC 26628]|uniref:alpha/beta hydrolase family protein n=1 Tax=Hymenobacter sp. PAMC 26628 TaxID=1484118 RepID=UPI0007700A5C|nr:alpha/beta fold hydrolase [Hymenobacter sp. PAMC 26628]AMJ67785.1 chlorophyllase [Hymenobacter sp. PAMC 26628]
MNPTQTAPVPSSRRDGTVSAPMTVISASPVVLAAPGRGEDLQVRVSAPATGRDLPIIVFSHGNGNSLDGYAPLVEFWAAHGFVVMQPTHLDSRMLGLRPEDPRTPRIWQFRVEDLQRILDHLDLLEAAVPGLAGRLDRSRIAAVGHSWGAQTVSLLLGARVLEPGGGLGADMTDARIQVGVLLSAGGGDLTPSAAQQYPFMNRSFAQMTTPALVVAGDKDISHLTARGPDWFTDPYFLSPAGKCLVTLFGGEHLLGGISGFRVTETSDENPARVAAVQQLTGAYLRSAFYPDDPAWPAAQAALRDSPQPLGKVVCK